MNYFYHFKKKLFSSKKYDINNNCYERLVNVDETPIYMEMPENKTVEFKGAKDIDIATFGGEKVRISLILACAGNGTKLPPLLIFKAKRGGKLEKNLSSLSIVKEKKIFIFCQEKAWCDNDIFINWIKDFYVPYETLIIKKTCLLILDKAPSHCSDLTLEFMNKHKIKRVFIPGGLTRKLQPLDVAVNKSIKECKKKNSININ